MRFACEVIAAVRQGIGAGRAVGIRLSGDEFLPGGLTLDDMVHIAPRLEATGQLDFIHVGDALARRRLMDAILDGARVGRRL